VEDLIIQSGICFFVPLVLFSHILSLHYLLCSVCLLFVLTIILLILDLAELQIHQLEMQKVVSRAGRGTT